MVSARSTCAKSTDQVALGLNLFTSAITTFTSYQAEYGGRWYEGRFYSFADVDINNPVLTVYYSPISEVPEPASWLMLFAGLVTLPLLNRRLGQRFGAQSTSN